MKETAMSKILLDIEKRKKKNGSVIAKELGITRQAYHQYKRRDTISYKFLKRLADKYNLSFNQLVKTVISYDNE